MWTRNCPKCDKERSYAYKGNFRYAEKHNSPCTSCAHLGKRSKESLQEFRRKRTDSSTSPKRTKIPDSADLHWAAGFVEGEGSFRGTKNTEMVEVSQVQLWPLEKLQQMFGGSIKKKSGNGKRQDFFLWRIWGARARGLQMTLYSLMSPRRQKQIQEVLKKWQ
jgi:hypothetical protein